MLSGTKRFGELHRSVGCSQKVLTENLKELEQYELVNRKVYAEIPPKVEYSLTETGLSLKQVLNSMAEWGEYYRNL